MPSIPRGAFSAPTNRLTASAHVLTSSRSSAPRLAAILLWLIIGITCILPLAWMMAQLVRYPALLNQLNPLHLRWALLGRTLLYNGSAAILATFMSLPAAVVIGRGRGPLAAAV